MEQHYIFFAECCYKKPRGKFTAYYKNGRVWSSKNFSRYKYQERKPNSISQKSFSSQYIEVTVPNYSEGMILHKRKLEITNKIERTLVSDAIEKKQFELYNNE